MKVLVVNCGSSSLKYQVLDMKTEALLCKGLVERIGLEGSVLKHEKEGMDDKHVVEVSMKDHKDAIGNVLRLITDAEVGVAKDMSEIQAVGHRVVHAGEKYSSSVVINDEVMKAIEECVDLAPLHNPPNILGIKACQELMPTTPMVAVFDTPSIRLCRKKLISTPFHMNIMKNTESEDTASTEPAINMWLSGPAS